MCSLPTELVQWSVGTLTGVVWVWGLADAPSHNGHLTSQLPVTTCPPIALGYSYIALISIRRVGERFHQYTFGPSSVCTTVSLSFLSITGSS